MISRPGVRYALLAALLFGASTPLAKGLLTDVSAPVLAGLVYLGSGIGLSVLWLLRRRALHAAEARLARRDLPWLVGAIGFGGVLAPLLLLGGLARTPASAASLLLNLEGVFTALLAWFAFRENVDWRVALGMGQSSRVGHCSRGKAGSRGAGSADRSRSRPRASAGPSTTT